VVRPGRRRARGGSLARVDLCGEPGDSGAPIFSGQKAYGLLKGTNNPDDPCEDRLYQGITEATQRLHVAVALLGPQQRRHRRPVITPACRIHGRHRELRLQQA
jgi:hypothetical protein